MSLFAFCLTLATFAAATKGLPALVDDYLTGTPLDNIDPPGLSETNAAALNAARRVQAGCQRQEDAEHYRARAIEVAEKLGISSDRAEEITRIYSSCQRRPNSQEDPAPTQLPVDLSANDAFKELANFNSNPRDTGASGASLPASGKSPPKTIPRTPKAPVIVPPLVPFNTEVKARETGRSFLGLYQFKDVPPTVDPVAKKDIATLLPLLKDLKLTPEEEAAAPNADSLRAFMHWAQLDPHKTLPPVAYGDTGKNLSVYTWGWWGKIGAITLDKTNRAMPQDERAAALLGGLYHYWDAQNSSDPESNHGSDGFKGLAFRPERSYNAYYLTQLYWRKISGNRPKTTLSKRLDNLPDTPEKISARVGPTSTTESWLYWLNRSMR